MSSKCFFLIQMALVSLRDSASSLVKFFLCSHGSHYLIKLPSTVPNCHKQADIYSISHRPRQESVSTGGWEGLHPVREGLSWQKCHALIKFAYCNNQQWAKYTDFLHFTSQATCILVVLLHFNWKRISYLRFSMCDCKFRHCKYTIIKNKPVKERPLTEN